MTDILKKCVAAVGAEYVITTPEVIDRFAQCTLPHCTRPLAIVKPGSTDEVEQIVKLANKYKVPIYPISGGKNWGYGDACAVTDGQIILDLSRMNKIREVNSTLAYAVIEPGVTQQQLFDYLRKHKLPLWLDVTGAGPNASIMGNAVERGFGHTPYGNHFAHTCGMEVVLPTGELIHTGFGAFKDTKAGRVFPSGLGPFLDGLFSQSNFGVVTALGIWLMREPEACLGFGFTIANENDLGGVVEILRELRLQDVINSTVHIGNDLRAISEQQQYPWDETRGKTPLPDNIRQALRSKYGLGAWNLIGALYGSKAQVNAARRVIRLAFKPYGKVIFFDEKLLHLGKKLLSPLSRISSAKKMYEKIRMISHTYDLLRGIPSIDHLRGIAWRSRHVDRTAVNPSEHGLIWAAPVFPMTKAACDEVLPITSRILLKHGFDLLITVSSINERALVGVISIDYNNQNKDESIKAAKCYHELFAALASRGYLPYRAGIQAMPELARLRPDTHNLIANIKETLDPNHILSPGRYEL